MFSAAPPALSLHDVSSHQYKSQCDDADCQCSADSDFSNSEETDYSHTTQSAELSLFATVAEPYNASTEWLDGSSPLHPYFDDGPRIQSIATGIKNDILVFALEACHLILDSLDSTAEPNHLRLSESLSQNPQLWRGVLLAQHYGVIYFMSRYEAARTYQRLMNQHPTTADVIDAFLRSHSAAGIRVLNYAVYKYVTHGGLRVDYATSCVPPNAISCAGSNHVVVRAPDFAGRSATEILACATPMWDLHDFAHLTCATLSPELFGNKYQNHLLRLPRTLTALIRSPGTRTATGLKISDGLVFSELLTKMFTDAVVEAEKTSQYPTYAGLAAHLAHELAEYYLGQRGLEHPSTGQMLSLPGPVSPTQPAVLVQNKSYELPASEIEQRVFTRGGPPGAKEDLMLDVTARERTAWLAESRSWGYFEVRNTIKHRAHKEAYRLVCEELMSRVTPRRDWERELLDKIMANILYADWKKGERVILWDLL